MEITGARTLVVNAEVRNWVFVRVETDQPGLYGFGGSDAGVEDARRGRRCSRPRAAGVLVIGVLNDGMIPTGVPTFCQMVAKGVLMIAALTIAEYQGRRYG